MNNNLLQKIGLKKIAIVIFGVILLLFVSTHSITIVKSPVDTQVSVSNTPNNMKYSGLNTRHIKLTTRGNWFMSVKSGYNVSGAFVKTTPFMIPKTVHLNPGSQLESQKITSLGGNCVLYDDPQINQTITSTCSSDNNTIKILNNNNQTQSLVSDSDIVGTAPTPGGFVYLLKGRGSETYSLGSFSVKDSKPKIIKTFRQSFSQILVTNSTTGYYEGLLIGGRYYTQQNLEEKNAVSVNLEKYLVKKIGVNTAAKVSGDNIYLYQGSSLDSQEGESEVDIYNQQKLTVVSLKKGTETNNISIPSEYLFREFTVDKNGTIAFIGEFVNKDDSLICFVREVLDCTTLWNQDSFATNIVFSGDFLTYASNGKLWGFNANTKEVTLLYSDGGLRVISTNKLGSRFFIAALVRKLQNESTIYNFVLDPSKPAKNERRADSILPSMLGGNSEITADLNRKSILIYDFGSTPTPQGSLKKKINELGINTSLYDIKKINPVVSRAPSPIILTSPSDIKGD